MTNGCLNYVADNKKLSDYINWVIDFLFATTEFRIELPNKDEFKEKYNKIWTDSIKLMDLFNAKSKFLREQIIWFIYYYSNGEGLMNFKLCGSAGIPTIVFAAITIFGLFLFILSTCCDCCLCCGIQNNNNDTSTNQAIQSSSLL